MAQVNTGLRDTRVLSVREAAKARARAQATEAVGLLELKLKGADQVCRPPPPLKVSSKCRSCIHGSPPRHRGSQLCGRGLQSLSCFPLNQAFLRGLSLLLTHSSVHRLATLA